MRPLDHAGARERDVGREGWRIPPAALSGAWMG